MQLPTWPLTIVRREQDSAFEVVTMLLPARDHTDIDFITSGSERKHAKEIRKNLVWVLVSDPVWGRNTLLKKLLAMLK